MELVAKGVEMAGANQDTAELVVVRDPVPILDAELEAKVRVANCAAAVSPDIVVTGGLTVPICPEFKAAAFS